MNTQEEIVEQRVQLKAEIATLITEDAELLRSGQAITNMSKIAELRYRYQLLEVISNQLNGLSYR